MPDIKNWGLFKKICVNRPACLIYRVKYTTHVPLTWMVSLILAAMFTSGCVTTRVTRLTSVEYPPVEPDSVQVFLPVEEAPSPRIQLAVVTSVQQGRMFGDREERRERVIRALREKAGKIGADAIILREISPRPDAPDFLRGWAVAIRTGVAGQELAPDSTAPEPAVVVSPWAPPPVEAGTTDAGMFVLTRDKQFRIGMAGLIGAGIGLGLGAVTGAITEPGICIGGPCSETSARADAIIVGLLGALGGWGVGSAIGAATVIVNPPTPTLTMLMGSATGLIVGVGIGALVGAQGEHGTSNSRLPGPMGGRMFCDDKDCVLLD